ncbi:hypothetical protein VKT23_014167 [Stygiomarasmius scandens]|uniref:Helicase ATP-binding domain-containing protein n=1 Tax=Marasmiellus scandens TaxID=2682957 RepID=A0ABR1J2R4_9AGAR
MHAPGLEGRDIIGIAPTGSGKTAVFALPILHCLWERPQGLFACILVPTQELAYQIAAQFDVLEATMGVRSVAIIGGDEDWIKQAVALAKKPHIVVATPGRLDHLKATKGYQVFILDEANRLLGSDFDVSIEEILKVVPSECTTYLFSATLTSQVTTLKRANLRNPVHVQVSNKQIELKVEPMFPQ